MPHQSAQPPEDLAHRVPGDVSLTFDHEEKLPSRQAIRDLLDDTLPRRRDRYYERIKKPPKNTFPDPQTRPHPATQQDRLQNQHPTDETLTSALPFTGLVADI